MNNLKSFIDDESKDNETFSLSDKMTISGITPFEINEPNNKKKTCRCCIWSVLIIYLVILTGCMGLLAYQVFTMHKIINSMNDGRTAKSVNHLANASMENEIIFGINPQSGQENWIHNLKQEFHVIKLSNQHLQWEMANITDQIKSNMSQGIAGPPGPKGETGIPGRKGDQGDKGEKGDIGLTGIKGNPGTNGIGLPGPTGEPGVPGIQGYAGSPGEKGDTGAMGPIGTKGEQGLPGLPGLNGEKGSKGDLGPAGLKGEPGMKGEMGVMGSPGLPGSKGETGESGIIGPRGLTGHKGENGEKGNEGPVGPQGFSGPPGPQGNIGVTGHVGRPGAPGLRGEKGETGAASQVPGQKGAQGQKGSKGDTGSRGAQGSKGERGISGFGAFLRLVGQDNRGRVEILHKGEWGTICDDQWDVNDGNVICQMLGFNRAVNTFTAPAGSGKIWLDDVQCSGNELSIYLCSKREWGENNCSHSEDAGVECA